MSPVPGPPPLHVQYVCIVFYKRDPRPGIVGPAVFGPFVTLPAAELWRDDAQRDRLVKSVRIRTLHRP